MVDAVNRELVGTWRRAKQQLAIPSWKVVTVGVAAATQLNRNNASVVTARSSTMNNNRMQMLFHITRMRLQAARLLVVASGLGLAASCMKAMAAWWLTH